MSQRNSVFIGVAVGFGLASAVLFATQGRWGPPPEAGLRGGPGHEMAQQLEALQSEVSQSKLLIASFQSQLSTGAAGGSCEQQVSNLQAQLDLSKQEVASLRSQLDTAVALVARAGTLAQCSPNPSPAEATHSSSVPCKGPPSCSSQRMHLFAGSYDQFLDILTAPGFLTDWRQPPYNSPLDLQKPNGRPLNFAVTNHVLIPGIIVEGGVWTGNTIKWLANQFPDRKLYGFDSFEGLPEKWR